jgi:hypothetical protein
MNSVPFHLFIYVMICDPKPSLLALRRKSPSYLSPHYLMIPRILVYNLVLNSERPASKDVCCHWPQQSMYCLSLITDLKLINCVDTSD